MTKLWSYSPIFEPAAPIVQVNISPPPWLSSDNSINTFLQVDSGSCITGIPITSLKELNTKPIAFELVYDFRGGKSYLPVFEVSIVVNDFPALIVRVIGTRSEFGFLGRDILNKFIVILDGSVGQVSFGP
jgi:hypothetical protein